MKNLISIKTGSVIKRIILRDIKKLKILLLPLSVQKEIVVEIEKEQNYVDSCKKLIEINENKIKQKIDEVWYQI